jgi:hypothetical protein
MPLGTATPGSPYWEGVLRDPVEGDPLDGDEGDTVEVETVIDSAVDLSDASEAGSDTKAGFSID